MPDKPKPELSIADVGDLSDPAVTAAAAADLYTSLTGKPITVDEMAALIAEERAGG